MIIKFIKENKINLFWIISISLTNSIFFNLFFDNIIYADANEYNIFAKNLIKGAFSLNENNIYDLSMKREPLYPFVLSTIYRFFGFETTLVYYFQTIIFTLTCIISYLLSMLIFDKKISFISAILVASLPTLANYSSYLLTENLFSFLLILFTYLITLALIKDQMLHYIFSGIILGLATLTKTVLLPYFIIVIIIFLIVKKRKFPIKNILLFTIFFIMTISPWSYRNYKNFNTLEISLRGGDALWMSASTINYTSLQIYQNSVFNFSEYLGNKIFPDIVDNPRDFILLRNDLYQERAKQLSLENVDLNQSEIDDLLKKEALSIIIKKPHIYFIQRFLEFQKMLFFIYIPALNQQHVMDSFNSYNYGNTILSLIKAPFKLLSIIIFLLSIYGIFIKKNFFKKYVFVFLIILYINVVYSLLFGLGRYAVPIIPFYMIFCTAGLINFFNLNNNTNK